MSIAHPGLVERHPFPPNGVLRGDYSGMEQKVETTTLLGSGLILIPFTPTMNVTPLLYYLSVLCRGYMYYQEAGGDQY